VPGRTGTIGPNAPDSVAEADVPAGDPTVHNLQCGHRVLHGVPDVETEQHAEVGLVHPELPLDRRRGAADLAPDDLGAAREASSVSRRCTA
jgi:hypothetical protein